MKPPWKVIKAKQLHYILCEQGIISSHPRLDIADWGNVNVTAPDERVGKPRGMQGRAGAGAVMRWLGP